MPGTLRKASNDQSTKAASLAQFLPKHLAWMTCCCTSRDGDVYRESTIMSDFSKPSDFYTRRMILESTFENMCEVAHDMLRSYGPAASSSTFRFPLQFRFRDIVLYRHFKEEFARKGIQHVSLLCDSVAHTTRPEFIKDSLSTFCAGCLALAIDHSRCGGCKASLQVICDSSICDTSLMIRTD